MIQHFIQQKGQLIEEESQEIVFVELKRKDS